MEIRKACLEELDKIMNIYDNGRRFMRAHGNNEQWVNGFPQRELIEEDIKLERLFVASENDEIYAVFAYILGVDPTYLVIENGSWLNEEPYGTIHRLASTGKKSRITTDIFDWALMQCPNLRGDTHADNFVMQVAAEDFGFKMCGIIHLENGDPRIAYHVTKELRQKQILK